MHRRSTLAAAGYAVLPALGGCLGREAGDDEGDGTPDAFDLLLYNYRDEAVRLAVDAVADGESLVSGTFDLEAPDVVSTTERVATVPAGTRELSVEASVDDDATAAETFRFPREERLSAVEVRADPGGRLRIEPMGYEEPAE